MNWHPPETAPLDGAIVLAYGYELRPLSGLREEVVTEIVRWSGERWLCSGEGYGSDRELEMLGWLPIPEIPELGAIAQPQPTGEPKYKVGDLLRIQSRYEGIQPVKIVSVIGYPKGWFYELDEEMQCGKSWWVGAAKIQTDRSDGSVIGQPCPEYLLLE